MTIKLEPQHLETIRNHAESTYPEECCGLLLGHLDGEGKTVLEVWQTENAWNAEAIEDFQTVAPSANLDAMKGSNYTIAPKDILKAQKVARDRNWEIVGIYHSHPDHPAIPSEFDRAIAWQRYSYIIISVRQGEAADPKSWCLNENHQFQPEEILGLESTF